MLSIAAVLCRERCYRNVIYLYLYPLRYVVDIKDIYLIPVNTLGKAFKP